MIIPPSIDTPFYRSDNPDRQAWLQRQHGQYAIICSACADAFILATAGLLEHRRATIHWGLLDKFTHQHPPVKLDIDNIMVNDGDIITAAGMMSWVDLGLESVAQFCHISIMRQLGKHLVTDIGSCEQRYDQQFLPK